MFRKKNITHLAEKCVANKILFYVFSVNRKENDLSRKYGLLAESAENLSPFFLSQIE